MSERIYKFDNLKLLLIYLVVLGHVIDVNLGTTGGLTQNSRDMATLFVTIYTFHMPLFIFVSGLFGKRDSQRFPVERVVSFTIFGIIAKLLISLSWFVESGGATMVFNLFDEVGLPWFMFALAAFEALAWLIRNANMAAVLVLSTVIALAVGYDPQVGTFLTLSRIIVFFPFYWLGFCLDPARVKRAVDRPWVRIAALAVLVGTLAFILLNQGYMYSLRRVFTAWSSYEIMDYAGPFGPLNRLIGYGFALAMVFAVLALTPSRRIPLISGWGGRTLQIYIWHMPILTVLRYFCVSDLFAATGLAGWVWLEAISVSLAVVLVLLPGFWQKPLDLFMPKALARRARKRRDGRKDGPSGEPPAASAPSRELPLANAAAGPAATSGGSPASDKVSGDASAAGAAEVPAVTPDSGLPVADSGARAGSNRVQAVPASNESTAGRHLTGR